MSDNELPSSFLNEIDLQFSLFPDLPDLTNDDGLALSPLDRWKNSPPETEAVELSDIVNSIRLSNSQGTYTMRQHPQGATFSERGHRQSHRSTSSVAASDSIRSSGSSSSASSAHSFVSNLSGSFGRFYAGLPTRRRRRRQRKKSPVSRGRTQSPRRLYQCTFCTDMFKSKHDWVRHEKSLHLSLESWTCAPFGPTYAIEGATLSRCVYCDIENPSDTHVGDHRFWECQQKPSVLRTFYRKDHLIQHLRLVHGTENGISRVETWRSEVTHVNSRCGFCKETFTRWTDRNNHLAAHFREGLLMKDWKGCRGLDPAVALAVENAMPPYLIGAESTGINPFSASTRCPNSRNDIDRSPKNESCSHRKGYIQPTPFEQLTERLIRFVRERQAIGVPVTDDSIQHEARCFVYGDEDPWNQTAADSAEWLKLFKDGMGLGPSLSTTTNDAAAVLPKSSFPLPWTTNTTGTNEPQSPPKSCVHVAPPVDPWMPWAWQSPECLAEFRRSNDPS
ncbi:uncharacterized protein N7487_004323 [Penicillium crustosum]|uniref:uncharacterized protein n=1 Tax=Penicillium crustosum TaxID=36656 RepID=UPI0023A03AE8|nr:uncharacterized protein N7487_004323 [Penicillium crustosum]KAJ5409964.1 hypothetical protein N7487_004323 [Penicillium crustosum]